MSYLRLVLVFVLSTIAQLSIVNIFAFRGAAVNLPLCFAIVIAFLYDREMRVIVAIALSMLCADIMIAHYVGVSGIAAVLTMAFVVFYKGIVNNDNTFSIIPLAMISTFVYGFSQWLILSMLGNKLTFSVMVKHQAIVMLFNVVVSLFLYMVMKKRAIKVNRENRVDKENQELVSS